VFKKIFRKTSAGGGKLFLHRVPGRGSGTGRAPGRSPFWAASSGLCAVLVQAPGTAEPSEGFQHSENSSSHAARSSGERAAAQRPLSEASTGPVQPGCCRSRRDKTGGKLAQKLKRRHWRCQHNARRVCWAMKRCLHHRLLLAWVP